MKKTFVCFLLLISYFSYCAAQQVVSSGGYSVKSEVSINWILGGSLSDIPTYDLSTLTKLKKEQLMESEISCKVFPMPASDFINIEITPVDSGQFILELYNNSGVRVLNKRTDYQSVIQVNIQDIPVGFYFLKVVLPQNGQQIIVEKIIKQ
jgi:hypothetical protein